ncbi:HD-GYP domain-containing protein [Paenibacillus marinisediminis]
MIIIHEVNSQLGMVIQIMRVHILQVRDGDIVLKDIFNNFGVKIISAGTCLKERDIDVLLRHHIDMVEIMERLNPQLNIDVITNSTSSPGISETVPVDSVLLEPEQYVNPSIKQFYPQYLEAVKFTSHMFDHALRTGTISHEDVESTISPILEQFNEERDVVSLLLHLISDDDYICQHSLQVSMLSYYLAVWLGYSEQDALRIGRAGYLHDIGKSQIERSILDKPSSLSHEEFEQIKAHTTIGHQIISSSYSDEWLSIPALQHHERIDGSGYPQGLTGDQIHDISKIVAIADVYSAMISTRVYREKRDLFSVLNEMYSMSFNKLDPRMTHVFIRQMLPNFLHKRVKLSDGRMGTIIMNHSTEFFKPLVQINQEFIDLSLVRQVEIEHVYM